MRTTLHSPIAAGGGAPPESHGVRRSLVAGLALLVAGAMQGDGAILTSAFRGASIVDPERLSFPWEGAVATMTTLVWGATQAMIVAGFVVFALGGPATSRAGRIAAWAAAGGGALFLAGHGLSLLGPGSSRWSGWRRYAPLALGAWLIAVIPLQFPPALPAAVAVLSLVTMALGLAMVLESIEEDRS